MSTIAVGFLIFLVYQNLPPILGGVNDTGPVLFEETDYQDENDPYCCRNDDFYGSGREDILSDTHLYGGDAALEARLEEEHLDEQGNPSDADLDVVN